MALTDPTADLLTRIRNASRAHKDMVSVPYSKHKHAICNVLKESAYILNVKAIGEGKEKHLSIELDINKNDIHLRTVSKPGQRIYIKSKEIPRVLEGLGLAIVSTPQGVMSGQSARKAKLGGEYICEVY
jgi:small subunit ribosomal protein S8